MSSAAGQTPLANPYLPHMPTATTVVLDSQLSPKQEKLVRRMTNPLLYRLFAWKQLPSTAWWQVKVRAVGAAACEVEMPYGWRTQNPFSSTYFAAQCGAAELSTGALSLLHLEGKPRTSMLVTQFDSKYYKKAADTLRFECTDGVKISEAVAGTLDDGEGRTVIAHSRAYLPEGTLASEFWVTWSFRRKR